MEGKRDEDRYLMGAISFAAALLLASSPLCGNAGPDSVPRSEFAHRLAAIAIGESGGNPLTIGVNPDRVRGLPGGSIRFATAQQAAATARRFIAEGRLIDLGFMQINSRSLARHHLTVEAAFDECQSMRAGSEHFASDVSAAAVFALAHRRYNTGGFERGAAYAAGIEKILTDARLIKGAAIPAPIALPPARPAGSLFARSVHWDGRDNPGSDDAPRLVTHHGNQ